MFAVNFVQSHVKFWFLKWLQISYKLNLIMKLPNFILLWLSGKKQITIGNRSLLPAFQLICVQNEKLGLDLSQLSPGDFRSTYNAQNIFSMGLNQDVDV